MFPNIIFKLGTHRQFFHSTKGLKEKQKTWRIPASTQALLMWGSLPLCYCNPWGGFPSSRIRWSAYTAICCKCWFSNMPVQQAWTDGCTYGPKAVQFLLNLLIFSPCVPGFTINKYVQFQFQIASVLKTVKANITANVQTAAIILKLKWY